MLIIDTAISVAVGLPIQVWVVVGLALVVVFRDQLRQLAGVGTDLVDDLVGLETAVFYLVVVAAGVLFGRRVLPGLLGGLTESLAAIAGVIP